VQGFLFRTTQITAFDHSNGTLVTRPMPGTLYNLILKSQTYVRLTVDFTTNLPF